MNHRKQRLLAGMFMSWLTLLLAACGGQVEAAKKQQAAKVPETRETRVASSCQYDKFEDFLAAFERDAAFQRENVADPLEEQSIDALADPEPAVVSTLKALNTVAFPVYPSPAEQRRDGLVRSTKVSGDKADLKLSKPDSDYQFTYHFTKRPCWTLATRSDDSL